VQAPDFGGTWLCTLVARGCSSVRARGFPLVIPSLHAPRLDDLTYC